MRRAFALAFTAAMSLFALCALTAQAAKVAHLPEEITSGALKKTWAKTTKRSLARDP